MSPKMIVGLQRSLGENFDAKVQSYKRMLESKLTETLQLLCEVKWRKVGDAISVAEDSLKQYARFSPRVFHQDAWGGESEKRCWPQRSWISLFSSLSFIVVELDWKCLLSVSFAPPPQKKKKI